MAKPITVKSGQVTPVSGQYQKGKSKTEVTLVKGKTVPPNGPFTLVDKTKHSGK